MLIVQDVPKGIDIAVKKLQTMIHTKLLALWGLDTTAYECYGRCYRNKKGNGYIAEVYTGNNEYKEV